MIDHFSCLSFRCWPWWNV